MSRKSIRVQKTVIYKRVEFLDSSEAPCLEYMLRDAFNKNNTLGQLKLNRADSNDEPIFHIIKVADNQEYIFGTMMSYKPGQNPLYIESSEEKLISEIDPKQFAIEVNDGKPRQLLESILYFLVYRNNLAIIQSSSLKFADLQVYSSWLVKKCGELKPGNAFSFVDTPSQDVVDRFRQSKVKNIKIQAPIESEFFPGNQMEFSSDVGFEKNTSLSRGLFEAFLDFIKSKDNMSDVEMNALDPQNLSMDLVLSYKNRTNDSGYKVLREISSTLADSGLKFKVQLESGANFNEKDFRIQDKISVYSQNGQLDDSEVHSELKKWLMFTINNSSS